jgi:hypothetical protein
MSRRVAFCSHLFPGISDHSQGLPATPCNMVATHASTIPTGQNLFLRAITGFRNCRGRGLSALVPKVDMVRRSDDVRFVSQADSCCTNDVTPPLQAKANFPQYRPTTGLKRARWLCPRRAGLHRTSDCNPRARRNRGPATGRSRSFERHRSGRSCDGECRAPGSNSGPGELKG